MWLQGEEALQCLPSAVLLLSTEEENREPVALRGDVGDLGGGLLIRDSVGKREWEGEREGGRKGERERERKEII